MLLCFEASHEEVMVICMFASVLVNLSGQFDLLWSQQSGKFLGLPLSNFLDQVICRKTHPQCELHFGGSQIKRGQREKLCFPFLLSFVLPPRSAVTHPIHSCTAIELISSVHLLLPFW